MHGLYFRWEFATSTFVVIAHSWLNLHTKVIFICHRKLTQYDRSLVLLERSLSLDPNVEKKRELAQLYFLKGNKEKARFLITEIISSSDCGLHEGIALIETTQTFDL